MAAPVRVGAAEYRHCYRSDPPATAVEAPEDVRRKLFGLENGMLPVVYRKACRLLDARDARHVRALHASVGCSAKSDFAKAYERILTAPIAETPGLTRVDAMRAARPAAYDAFCDAVAAVPWPAYDEKAEPISDTIYGEFLNAMNAVLATLPRLWGAQ